MLRDEQASLHSMKYLRSWERNWYIETCRNFHQILIYFLDAYLALGIPRKMIKLNWNFLHLMIYLIWCILGPLKKFGNIYPTLTIHYLTLFEMRIFAAIILCPWRLFVLLEIPDGYLIFNFHCSSMKSTITQREKSSWTSYSPWCRNEVRVRWLIMFVLNIHRE